MNGHCLRYISHENEREAGPAAVHGHKARETYISPYKDQRFHSTKDKALSTSPARFGKPESSREKDNLPPRGGPFQRSRNVSVEKNEKQRNENRASPKGVEDNRREVMKFSQIKKKLEQEMLERERLQQLSVCQELKISNLGEQINKLRLEKKELERVILQLQKVNEQGKGNLFKASQNIQQLNKNLREARINQKSLNNLKNLQNQIDYLQERNKKLTVENQELCKCNNSLKVDLQKITRDCSQEEELNSKIVKSDKDSNTSLETRLLGQLALTKSERERFLESNLHELEKKLYDKENEMKKLYIQLNCIDRKKVSSIDEVKVKKDREIKDLRQRFMKVTKDLKETKDKFEKNEKKKERNLKDTAFLRKVKSSKHLGLASESEEVTLELSSQP